jgi:transcriptional regulator with GAF, ATPase, and Fis domain
MHREPDTLSSFDHDQSLTFAQIAEQLALEPVLELTLQKVAELALDTVPGCDFVGVSIREGKGKVTTPAATDAIAEQADNLQYELGEGPCLGAVWEGDQNLIEDMSSEKRWPHWAPLAADLGIRSVLSTRLATGANVVGALNLYSLSPHAFSSDSAITAHIYATHASAALTLKTKIVGLGTALQTRHAIGVAQGLLMLRYGLNEEKAFQVMSRLSSHQNIKLRDIAARVIDEFTRTGTLA